ncbi:MAG: CvpA family protein [Rhizobiales bacterium]|nr:CvpA family protein [Hyphomicrobiales bacterium]
MGFQLLDLILIGIMLLSGVLALMRGFTREVLSLLAWGLAAVAAYFAVMHEPLIQWTMANVPYADQPTLAKVAAGGATFLLVLIVVSVVMVKISDVVVDSSAGAFDRSLGFIYGLARGLVLVTIAFLYYGWLVTADKQEDWVLEAKSLPLIKAVGKKLLALMPPDIEEILTDTALAKNPEQTPATGTKTEAEPGYSNSTTQGMDNAIQGTGETAPQPSFGQGESQ